MPADLLNQFVEGRLNRRRWTGRLCLGRQLPGRQAQIQRDDGSFASGILLDHGSEVQQVGSENLEPLLDFLNLVVDFFFDVGSFVDLVTDVHVHCRASDAGEDFP